MVKKYPLFRIVYKTIQVLQVEGVLKLLSKRSGDGGNDTSMILQAGIGIAMGNAIDALKQQADYVTTSVDDDGILNALRHFEVI